MTPGRPDPTQADTQPDPAVAWRWLGAALRPVVGWALVAAGFAAITIGWFGVSREALVAKQLPYLLSGGIGGISLVFLGAVLLIARDLQRTAGRLDAMEHQLADLHRLLLAEVEPDRPVELTVLPGGQSYHRHGCAVVRGKPGAESISEGEARRRELLPCKLCEPAAGLPAGTLG